MCSGEIPIFDMAGFTWRHATKVVISTLRVYMKYTQVEVMNIRHKSKYRHSSVTELLQEAAPVTLRNIHLVNCPSYVDRVFMIVKPFLKKEVSKMVREANKIQSDLTLTFITTSRFTFICLAPKHSTSTCPETFYPVTMAVVVGHLPR